MSDQYPILKQEEIRYIGPFDFDEVYRHLYEWLEWRQYDVREKKFKDKMKPAAPIQREIEIKWIATKEIDEYTQFQYVIDYRIINWREVDVTKDGESKKIWNADLMIVINSNIILDKNAKWEENLPLHFIKKFFEAYVYKSTFERWKGMLWAESWGFYNEAKALLNLYKS